MVKKNYMIISILLLSLLILSSCWDAKEMQEISYINAVGIDLTDEGKLELTVKVLKPRAIGSGGDQSGGSQSEKPEIFFEGNGRTIFEIVRNFTEESSRKLDFYHNRVIIISEKAAKEGLLPILDFFHRRPDTNPTVFVLVSKERAADVLKQEVEQDTLQANEILNLINNRKNLAARIIDQDIHSTMTKLAGQSSFVIPMIDVNKEKKGFVLKDSAVVRRDRMVGELNDDETKGFVLTQNTLKEENYKIESSEENRYIYLSIKEADPKIKPKIKQDDIKIDVTLFVDADVYEVTGFDKISETEVINRIEKDLEKKIKGDIQDSIKKAKELKADIFGFGETIERKYPQKWKEVESDWDERFAQLDVTINVITSIRNLGLKQDPIGVKKER